MFDFPGERLAEDQLPLIAILRWRLVWGSVSPAQSEEEQFTQIKAMTTTSFEYVMELKYNHNS